MMINELLAQFGLEKENTWVFEVFLVVLITLFIAYTVNRLFKKLKTKFEKTENYFDDAFAIAARRPLRTLVWVVGLTFAVEIAHTASEVKLLSAIYPFRDVALIAIATWFANGFIAQIKTNIIKRAQEKGTEVDRTTVDAVSKILRASVIITAALIMMQSLGFSVSGILAFGGVGGLAIGFAAKDLLANFFGALMIYFDRPFKVGDWIRSPDQEIEGTVEEIGWRQTRIRTFDKRPLYVPNSLFSTISVENPSRMTHRRIYETFGVRYDDMSKVAAIVEDVKSMLKAHDEIDANQTLIVNLNSFASSSVDFFVYTFTKTTDWIKYHQVKEDVLLKVSNIVDSHGAEFAFPTSTLHVASTPEHAGMPPDGNIKKKA